MMGSTETTFYVLTIYYGAVQIKKLRHTLPACLLADLAGLSAALVFGWWFFKT
jgi:spore maturation protein SpmB